MPQRSQRGEAATKKNGNISRKARKDRQVTSRGSSSRAKARDLRKISPVGRNDNVFLCALGVPFDIAQDMLGGRNFRIRESSTSGIFKRYAMTNMLVLVFG